MVLSLRIKITLITITILFFAIGTNTLISSYIFTTEYSKALQSKTLLTGETLETQLERLLDLGIPLNQLVGFEDQCQQIVERYPDISYAMVIDIDGKIIFKK